MEVPQAFDDNSKDSRSGSNDYEGPTLTCPYIPLTEATIELRGVCDFASSVTVSSTPCDGGSDLIRQVFEATVMKEDTNMLDHIYATTRSKTPEVPDDCGPIEAEKITPVKCDDSDPLDPLTPTTNLKTLAATTLLHSSRLEQSSGYFSLSTTDDSCLESGSKKKNKSSVSLGQAVKHSGKVLKPEKSATTKKQQVQPDENLAETAAGRKNKSLWLLCDRFLASLPREVPDSGMDLSLDTVATELGVERRRIYDIVNVLESLNMVARTGKNVYAWYGYNPMYITLKQLLNVGMQNKVDKKLKLLREVESLEYAGAHVSPSKRAPLKDISNCPVLYAAETCRKDRSMGLLCQRFLTLFLVSEDPRILNLDMSAKMLIPQNELLDKKQSSKVRRLYDIANVLYSLGLLRKLDNQECKLRKPVFQYVGPSMQDLQVYQLTAVPPSAAVQPRKTFAFKQQVSTPVSSVAVKSGKSAAKRLLCYNASHPLTSTPAVRPCFTKGAKPVEIQPRIEAVDKLAWPASAALLECLSDSDTRDTFGSSASGMQDFSLLSSNTRDTFGSSASGMHDFSLLSANSPGLQDVSHTVTISSEPAAAPAMNIEALVEDGSNSSSSLHVPGSALCNLPASAGPDGLLEDPRYKVSSVKVEMDGYGEIEFVPSNFSQLLQFLKGCDDETTVKLKRRKVCKDISDETLLNVIDVMAEATARTDNQQIRSEPAQTTTAESMRQSEASSSSRLEQRLCGIQQAQSVPSSSSSMGSVQSMQPSSSMGLGQSLPPISSMGPAQWIYSEIQPSPTVLVKPHGSETSKTSAAKLKKWSRLKSNKLTLKPCPAQFSSQPGPAPSGLAPSGLAQVNLNSMCASLTPAYISPLPGSTPGSTPTYLSPRPSLSQNPLQADNPMMTNLSSTPLSFPSLPSFDSKILSPLPSFVLDPAASFNLDNIGTSFGRLASFPSENFLKFPSFDLSPRTPLITGNTSGLVGNTSGLMGNRINMAAAVPQKLFKIPSSISFGPGWVRSNSGNTTTPTTPLNLDENSIMDPLTSTPTGHFQAMPDGEYCPPPQVMVVPSQENMVNFQSLFTSPIVYNGENSNSSSSDASSKRQKGSHPSGKGGPSSSKRQLSKPEHGQPSINQPSSKTCGKENKENMAEHVGSSTLKQEHL